MRRKVWSRGSCQALSQKPPEGFYFAVLREGETGAGDTIDFLGRDENRVSVADITRLYAFDHGDVATMRRAVEVKALSDSWRGYFRHRIEKTTHSKPAM